jgi:hypothetical protein
MNKEFPCKVCGHIANMHYMNITRNHSYCADCLRAENCRSYQIPSEYEHEFVGDNFKYLEMLDKRKEMKNENL